MEQITYIAKEVFLSRDKQNDHFMYELTCSVAGNKPPVIIQFNDRIAEHLYHSFTQAHAKK